MNKSHEVDKKKQILHRIKKIVVERHPIPLGLSGLNLMYEKKFKEKLLFREVFASRTLSSIIKEIPSLDTRMEKAECCAFVCGSDIIKLKEVLLDRIENIVYDSHPKPLRLSQLNILYENKFKEKVNFKEIFVSRSLSGIIKKIPSLDTKIEGSECYAFLFENEPSLSKQKALLLTRIENIVFENHPTPIGLSNLNVLYEKKFNEKLVFKNFFSSLSRIIRDIPRLQTQMKKSECYAFIPNGKETSLLKKQLTQSCNFEATGRLESKRNLRSSNEFSLEESSEKCKILNFVKTDHHSKIQKFEENSYCSKGNNEIDLKVINEQPNIETFLGFELDDDDTNEISHNFRDMHEQYVRNGCGRSSLLHSDSSTTDSCSFTSSYTETESLPKINKLENYFKNHLQNHTPYRYTSLCDSPTFRKISEGGLFGHILPQQFKTEDIRHTHDEMYISTEDPFCMVIVGAQVTGKSHTVSCILENCLLDAPLGDVIKCSQPMTALTFYYGQCETSICEAIGLVNPDIRLSCYCGTTNSNNYCVPKKNTIVLVSPTSYKQRLKAYVKGANFDNVCPLLFKWASLEPKQIRYLMSLNCTNSQFEEITLSNLFRQYRRRETFPCFPDFLQDVREAFKGGEKYEIEQKILALKSWIAESNMNENIENVSLDLSSSISSGKYFIIVDLTDRLLNQDEANGVFEILINQFRCLPTNGKKVLALDTAKNFIADGKINKLNRALIDTAKSMIHDQMSIVVTVENPKTLPTYIYERATITVFHYFHSPYWWSHLRKSFPLNDESWEKILRLEIGDAMLIAPRQNIGVLGTNGLQMIPLRIRKRITSLRQF